MLSEEDRSILQLIESCVRRNPPLDLENSKRRGQVAAALLSGMAGDALHEDPISQFGKRMSEAIDLLESGFSPQCLCSELERRWTADH